MYVKRRQNLRIGIEQDARRFGNAETILENFKLDHPFEVVLVGFEIRIGKCNSARLNVLLEIGEHRIGNLERRRDRGIGRQEIFVTKPKYAYLSRHQILKIIQLRNR